MQKNSLKKSRYLTETLLDPEQDGSHSLIYSHRSGSIRLISNEYHELLKKNHLEALPDGIVSDLIRTKILVSSGEDELLAVLSENQEHIKKNDILYLPIQPTSVCPLGCGYCGQSHREAYLSEEAQLSLLNYLENSFQKHLPKELQIAWFGAEPLAGFEALESMSRKLIALSASHQVNYSAHIVTNAVLLTKSISRKLINDLRIRTCEITFDGLSTQHDQRRPTKRGQGTFERSFKNLVNFIESAPPELSVSIRCNVDGKNSSFVKDFIHFLGEQAWRRRISFYTAPVHSWGNDAHEASLSKIAFAKLEVEWLRLLGSYEIQHSLLAKRQKEVCFAVNPSAFLISADGTTYDCSEYPLVPAYEDSNGKNLNSIGSLLDSDGPISRRTELIDWNNKLKASEFPCSSCPFLPSCGGACPKEWLEGRVPCPSFKFNMEERLRMHAQSKKRVNLERTLSQAHAQLF